MTKKTTADGIVKYEYDGGENGLGKLTSMSEDSQTKKMEYDSVGRVKKETRSMNGERFETEYEYDLLGRTKTIEYPNDPRSGERVTVEYFYGPFGAESVRLKQGFRSKNVIESIEYNENGQIERIVRGNRTETKYVYDGRHRLKKLYAYNTANGEELQNVSYTFDDDDNVTKKADEIGFGNGKRAVVSEYKYDGLNRLIEGKGRYELGETGEHWNAYTEKYSYSDDGNLLSKSLYDKTGSLDERLEYDYSNHAVTDIHSSKHGNRSVMRYSACGNMTYNSDKAKKTEKRMYYNTDNRIVKVTDKENITIGEYDYDDTGFRVRKQSRYMKDGVEKSKETITPSMYFSYEKELEISTDKELDKTYAVSHIYLNGVRIAAAMPNGECRYFLTDQVDSVNVVLNDKGDAVTRTEYKPYGETWIQEGDKTNRPKFNSQELDPETGYYFYNARYYEAEIGRFITADNVIDGEYSTQGWNRFSYVKNNPVRYKDPSGNSQKDAESQALASVGQITERHYINVTKGGAGTLPDNFEEMRGKQRTGSQSNILKTNYKQEVIDNFKKRSWTDSAGKIHSYSTSKIGGADLVMGEGVSLSDIRNTKSTTFNVLGDMVASNNIVELTVSSLYRTPSESSRIRGSSSTSPHTRGAGVDITGGKIRGSNGEITNILFSNQSRNQNSEPSGVRKIKDWATADSRVSQVLTPWTMNYGNGSGERANRWLSDPNNRSGDYDHRHHMHLTIIVH